MNAAAGLRAFEGQAYLSLKTYRRNGVGVATPVWFAAADDADDPKLYVYSGAASGKAKRIRYSGRVRIAPCDIRGKVTGAWMDAHATLVEADEFQRAMRLLNRKYWPWKGLLDLLMRLRPGKPGPGGHRIVIAITGPDGAAGGD